MLNTLITDSPAVPKSIFRLGLDPGEITGKTFQLSPLGPSISYNFAHLSCRKKKEHTTCWFLIDLYTDNQSSFLLNSSNVHVQQNRRLQFIVPFYVPHPVGTLRITQPIPSPKRNFLFFLTKYFGDVSCNWQIGNAVPNVNALRKKKLRSSYTGIIFLRDEQ